MAGRRLSHVALIFFLSLSVAPAASKTLGVNQINTVRLTQRGQNTVVEIAGERAPNFTTFKQMTPRRVIVDVAECDLNGVPKNIDGDGKIVEKITTARYGRAPHIMSRVIIRLSQEAEYKVTIRGGTLFVHLAPGAGGLLVSAGVPVGPDRKLRKKAVAMNSATSRDQALSEELSEPAPKVEDLGAPQEALHVDSVAVPEPAADTEPEGDESEPDLVLAAAQPPRATRSQLHKAQPEPVAVPEVPDPGPDGDTESEPIGDVASSPTPSPASVEVAMAQEEETDEVPVEVVEEVQEVNEEEMPPPAAPEESEEPPPPPPPPLPDEEMEEAVPPPPEEYVEQELNAPAPTEERVEISSAIKNMTWVGFQQTRDSSRVFIKTSEPVKFHVVEEGRNLIVLELENTRIPVHNNTRFLDTHFFDSAVTMIVPREIEGISRNVRVEIQLRNRVPYTSGQEGNLVYINFQRPQ